MEVTEETRSWLKRNRARIEARGFTARFEKLPGEVVAIIDIESQDVLARIYVFDTGLISCEAGTTRGVIAVDAPIDDHLPLAENLSTVTDFILQLQ